MRVNDRGGRTATPETKSYSSNKTLRFRLAVRGFSTLSFMAMFILSMALLTTASLSSDFKPVDQFRFTLPNGQDFTSISTNDKQLNQFLASQALQVFARDQVKDGLAGVAYVDKNFFDPIQASLQEVKSAQERSDSEAARSAALKALAKIGSLNSRHDYELIASKLALAGNDHTIADLSNAFFKYGRALQRSVNQAQLVPSQIEAYIKSNDSGIRLRLAAQDFQGRPYVRHEPGAKNPFVCSDLVIAAAKKAGVRVSEAALPQRTVTQTWLTQGMGPEFRQVFGGESGQPLSKLIAAEENRDFNIPIGAVIVADGHAAIFGGVIPVRGQSQLIIYDANEQEGWTVSLAGKPSPGEPKSDTLFFFPGKQVGEHVTREQWGLKHLVKVFQPIGNHPI